MTGVKELGVAFMDWIDEVCRDLGAEPPMIDFRSDGIRIQHSSFSIFQLINTS